VQGLCPEQAQGICHLSKVRRQWLCDYQRNANARYQEVVGRFDDKALLFLTGVLWPSSVERFLAFIENSSWRRRIGVTLTLAG
jgi:hypothetical protein